MGQRSQSPSFMFSLGIYMGIMGTGLIILVLAPFLIVYRRFAYRSPWYDCGRWLIWQYAYWVIKWVKRYVPITSQNLDVLLKYRPGILVMNHLSAFDLFMLGLLPVHNVNITVRNWPFHLFWFAPFMKLAEYLNLEKAKWEGLLEAGKREKDRGAFILIFPEGHRSRNGTLQRFHPGAFRLAMELDLPVIPLCVAGTHTFLQPGSFLFSRTNLSLAALNPFFPSIFQVNPQDLSTDPLSSGYRELSKQVKKTMETYFQNTKNCLN